MEDEEAGLDDEGENGLHYLVDMEYEEASLDDEQNLAMKELKRMDRNKWTKNKPTFEQFNTESDLGTVNLKVGQIFSNAKVFKEATREQAIKQGISIWFSCNEKPRVQAKRYTKALRLGKEFKKFDFLEGSLATQYAKLWDYVEEIRRSNPGSTIVIDTEEGMDACHTKGNHKAQFMFAIGIDTDNSYYPIAYAIDEKECYMTWFWFLSLLKVDLKLDEDFRITFMMDKQKRFSRGYRGDMEECCKCLSRLQDAIFFRDEMKATGLLSDVCVFFSSDFRMNCVCISSNIVKLNFHK
ncbi:hypothetical protein Ddye_021292 [Dipteronia dyeriana]|uniref:MULE transposase domain-containing protein n=1 Tax=Dipteronia dyeriana TaxID=168575 RepID=A0AAD9WXK4_9ROSI|nr:hypothetical protein Ddye_021292 [Dipteronia dyeriana]